MNLLALGVAVVIVLICFPFFGPFIGKDIAAGTASSGIWHAPLFWLATLSVYLVSALLVGAYPAFVLYRLPACGGAEGKFVNSGKGIFLRKSLVDVQFVLSLLLIAGSITVYSQLSFMQHQSLGYNKDQMLVVKAPAITDSTFGQKIKVFEARLLQDPGIAAIGASSDIPGKEVIGRNGIRKATEDKTHNFLTSISEVNENFFGTFQMPLAAGRNLQITDSVNPFSNNPGQPNILINERVVKALVLKTTKPPSTSM